MNLVYSTNPRFSLDSAGNGYCAKGHGDVNIVLGELIGHILAGYLQIPVPGYAVARNIENPDDVLFASSVLQNVIREVSPFIRRKKVSNLRALAKIIALDVWLANNDRNIGNLLGSPCPSGGAAVSLVAIDFEKSMTVTKKAPLVEIPMMSPGAFWPRGELGTYCKGLVAIDDAALHEFKSITDEQIQDAVRASFDAVGVSDENRMMDIVHVLINRRDEIENLAKAEWN